MHIKTKCQQFLVAFLRWHMLALHMKSYLCIQRGSSFFCCVLHDTWFSMMTLALAALCCDQRNTHWENHAALFAAYHACIIHACIVLACLHQGSGRCGCRGWGSWLRSGVSLCRSGRCERWGWMLRVSAEVSLQGSDSVGLRCHQTQPGLSANHMLFKDMWNQPPGQIAYEGLWIC